MSGPSYQVWLRDIASDALHLDLTDYLIELEWTRIASDVGAFSCVLPESFPKEYLNLDTHLDWRVEIWRRADEASPLKLENVGLIRRVTLQTDEEGRTMYVLSGPDVMHILARRVVWPSDLRTTSPSMYAADHMRWLVRKNLISPENSIVHIDDTGNVNVTVPRTIPTTLGWALSCEADTNTGDAMSDTDGALWLHWKYAGMNVLDALKQIYSWSTEPDRSRSHLYFTIDFDDYKTWVFRVHPNRIGMDHSGDSGDPVLIGLDYGNLSIPVLDYDRNQEYVCAIAFTGSLGSPDYIGHYGAVDETRMNHSPINYSEACVMVSSYLDATRAKNDLFRKGLKHRIFTGKIVQGPGKLYGRDWGFGDEVVISYLGQQYEADVVGVRAKLNNVGEEEMQTMLDIPPV